jgi:probable HAF family extracellular repeat protein
MRYPAIAALALVILSGCTDPESVTGGVVVLDPAQAPPLHLSHAAIDLGTLGGDQSVATGINNAGVIAGTSLRPDGRSSAFRWTGNSGMTPLEELGDVCSGATDINNAGDIVGWFEDGAVPGGGCALLATPGWGTQPFKVSGAGELSTFPNAQQMAAVGVNNRGDVLGWTGFWANRVWYANGTEWSVCPGYSMVLFTVADGGDVLGGAFAFAPTGWGGVRWSRPDEGCDSQRGDASFRTVWISDGNARGEEVGLGVIWEVDPALPGGGRALSPWIGFLFSPGEGYLPLDFTPSAISNVGHVVGRRDDQAVLRTPTGELIELGQGNALGVNNFGDVVGTSGAGRAVLWTQRPTNFPRGGRLVTSAGSQLSEILELERRSACPSRFAFLAAMAAFPECTEVEGVPLGR